MRRKSSWFGVQREKGLSMHVPVYIRALGGFWVVDIKHFPSSREEKDGRKTRSLMRADSLHYRLCISSLRWWHENSVTMVQVKHVIDRVTSCSFCKFCFCSPKEREEPNCQQTPPTALREGSSPGCSLRKHSSTC